MCRLHVSELSYSDSRLRTVQLNVIKAARCELVCGGSGGALKASSSIKAWFPLASPQSFAMIDPWYNIGMISVTPQALSRYVDFLLWLPSPFVSWNIKAIYLEGLPSRKLIVQFKESGKLDPHQTRRHMSYLQSQR